MLAEEFKRIIRLQYHLVLFAAASQARIAMMLFTPLGEESQIDEVT